MDRATVAAIRFLRSWYGKSAEITREEVTIQRDDGPVPGTLILPAGHPGPLPGWVVLHGLTRPGRKHESMERFARALASTRAAVLLPEIPEWAALRLAPERAIPTIKAAILSLDERPEVQPGHIGLVGFSFGAVQALVAASDPRISPHLSGVFGFGGYRDLVSTFQFQMSGHFHWEGQDRYLQPDPYGRWIAAGNLLPHVSDLEDCQDVADALLRLAELAGDQRLAAWDPIYDPAKKDFRATIAPERRALFDLFAPQSGDGPTPEEAQPIVDGFHDAVTRVFPLLDPGPHLSRVTVPVRLVHGKEDHLIPFSETLKLETALAPHTDTKAVITGLFAHSDDHPVQSLFHGIRDGLVFFRALREILRLV